MGKIKHINIPYTPRYPEVHAALESHRFCVLVAHRRFGKTVLSINHLIKMATLCKRPRGVFAYIAPFRNQAKDVAWDYLKHYTAPLPQRTVNESELFVTVPGAGGGARIRIFGADNPHALRGLYLDGVVMDEVAQMKPDMWKEVVRPALADRQGFAVFIGTPRGINLFSELYYQAVERMTDRALSDVSGGLYQPSGMRPNGALAQPLVREAGLRMSTAGMTAAAQRERSDPREGRKRQPEQGKHGRPCPPYPPACRTGKALTCPTQDVSGGLYIDTWYAASFPVTATSALSAAEVENLRNELSENAFRQEMLCDFSAASDDMLIPLSLIEEAQTRVYREAEYNFSPLILGVDVARFGDDASVLFFRQGLAAYEPIILRKVDNMALADRIAFEMREKKPDAVFVDAGGGAGVIDRLRQLGMQVIEVPFGASAARYDRFVNKRMEMWQDMKDWLKGGGALPKNEALKAELSAPTYSFDAKGLIKLEPKDKIKERLGRSTDMADALALTFAMPVAAQVFGVENMLRIKELAYDPLKW